MISIETFKKLKKRAEDLKTSADRAQGVVDQLLAKAKQDFKCNNLKELQAHAKQLEVFAEQAETKFERALGEFKETWGDLFDDLLDDWSYRYKRTACPAYPNTRHK